VVIVLSAFLCFFNQIFNELYDKYKNKKIKKIKNTEDEIKKLFLKKKNFKFSNDTYFVLNPRNFNADFISFMNICDVIYSNDSITSESKFTKINLIYQSNFLDIPNLNFKQELKNYLVETRFLCSNNHKIIKKNLQKTLLYLVSLIGNCDNNFLLVAQLPVSLRKTWNDYIRRPIADALFKAYKSVTSACSSKTGDDDGSTLSSCEENSKNDDNKFLTDAFNAFEVQFEPIKEFSSISSSMGQYITTDLPLGVNLNGNSKKMKLATIDIKKLKELPEIFTSYLERNNEKVEQLYEATQQANIPVILSQNQSIEDHLMINLKKTSAMPKTVGFRQEVRETMNSFDREKWEAVIINRTTSFMFDYVNSSLVNYINTIKANFTTLVYLYINNYISLSDYMDQTDYGYENITETIYKTKMIDSIKAGCNNLVDVLKTDVMLNGSNSTIFGAMFTTLGHFFGPASAGASIIVGFGLSYVIGSVSNTILESSSHKRYDSHVKINRRFHQSIIDLNQHLIDKRDNYFDVGDCPNCTVDNNQRWKLFETANYYSLKYFEDTNKYFDNLIEKYNFYMNIYFLLCESKEDIDQALEARQAEAAAAEARRQAEEQTLKDIEKANKEFEEGEKIAQQTRERREKEAQEAQENYYLNLSQADQQNIFDKIFNMLDNLCKTNIINSYLKAFKFLDYDLKKKIIENTFQNYNKISNLSSDDTDLLLSLFNSSYHATRCNIASFKIFFKQDPKILENDREIDYDNFGAPFLLKQINAQLDTYLKNPRLFETEISQIEDIKKEVSSTLLKKGGKKIKNKTQNKRKNKTQKRKIRTRKHK
jgi:hypothetical protein